MDPLRNIKIKPDKLSDTRVKAKLSFFEPLAETDIEFDLPAKKTPKAKSKKAKKTPVEMNGEKRTGIKRKLATPPTLRHKILCVYLFIFILYS